MRFDIHYQYIRIIAALSVRELSHEEFNRMRAEMYNLSAREQEEFHHDDAQCPFQDEPSAKQMDEAVLGHVGSGRKVEKFRGITI